MNSNSFKLYRVSSKMRNACPMCGGGEEERRSDVKCEFLCSDSVSSYFGKQKSYTWQMENS